VARGQLEQEVLVEGRCRGGVGVFIELVGRLIGVWDRRHHSYGNTLQLWLSFYYLFFGQWLHQK